MPGWGCPAATQVPALISCIIFQNGKLRLIYKLGLNVVKLVLPINAFDIQCFIFWIIIVLLEIHFYLLFWEGGPWCNHKVAQLWLGCNGFETQKQPLCIWRWGCVLQTLHRLRNGRSLMHDTSCLLLFILFGFIFLRLPSFLGPHLGTKKPSSYSSTTKPSKILARFTKSWLVWIKVHFLDIGSHIDANLLLCRYMADSAYRV